MQITWAACALKQMKIDPSEDFSFSAFDIDQRAKISASN